MTIIETINTYTGNVTLYEVANNEAWAALNFHRAKASVASARFVKD